MPPPRSFWSGFTKGIWQGGLTYSEAVDELLCFGWIDGVNGRLDDERYTIGSLRAGRQCLEQCQRRPCRPAAQSRPDHPVGIQHLRAQENTDGYLHLRATQS